MINNIIKPNWPATNNINAFVTLKNCNVLDVIDNKKNTVFWLEQEHGINILPASNLNKPKADGSFTQQSNTVCIVKTADCLPILVCNQQGTFVAAIHAGWRGLAQGIIYNFFGIIKHLKLNHQDLLFWLGPAIGPNAFEVGEDVIEKFNDLDFGLYNNSFNYINNNKYLANIYKIAITALTKFNINKSQIFSNNWNWCTYSQPDLFYSHRRDPTNTNRMFSLIWID